MSVGVLFAKATTQEIDSYENKNVGEIDISSNINDEEEDYMGTHEPDIYVNSFEIQERIDNFLEELDVIQNSYSRPFKISKDQRLSKTFMKKLSDDVKSNERKLKSIDLRWNIFYQIEQPAIASDEELMALVDDLNNVKTSVEDSIASRHNIINAIQDFTAAERYLADQDTVYKSIGKKAIEFSLSSKTAPQLETLKVKEQLLFADIQAHYDKAREGSKQFKVSQQEIDNLNNLYASLKNKSVKIQEMAYQPFLQRIKDYLLGFAAIAIIIMFINMIVSKVKATKKMKENLKKYQDSITSKTNNDIPTI